MLYAKALIVNHAVIKAPSVAPRVNKVITYLARLEQHLSKGGLDQTITDDDKRLARIQDMVDYRTRSGRFENLNQDIPMAKGEVSGGCFDIRGVRDVSTLAREIEQSGSNLVTSFISVRREHAEELGLMTKQDFQRLYRNTWERHFSKLGIIKPHDMRSVAFFHTDNPVNLHIHILSWDESGRFSGDALIPKSNLMPARQIIYQEVFKPDLKELYIAKDYLRELTLAQVRTELGQPVSLGAHMKLGELRNAVSIPQYRDRELRPAAQLVGAGTKQALREDVIGERTQGYVQYGSLPKESRARIDDFKRTLFEGSRSLSSFDALYRQLSNEMGELNGYKDIGLKEYVNRQMEDLERRVGNVISKDLGVAPNTMPPDVAQRNLKGTAAVASLSIKDPLAADIDKLSWAFTPEQKSEIEVLHGLLKRSADEEERAKLIAAISNKIYALPSIQARVKQSSLDLAQRGNMNYEDAYRVVSGEYRETIERVVGRSGEESVVPKTGDATNLFMALMYAIPSSTRGARTTLDSLQKIASWKQNRERHALGKRSAIRRRQWNTMG